MFDDSIISTKEHPVKLEREVVYIGNIYTHTVLPFWFFWYIHLYVFQKSFPTL